MTRHVHQEDAWGTVSRHLNFFVAVPSEHKPKNLVRLDSDRCSPGYAYDRVDGHQPRNNDEIQAVYEEAMVHLWPRTGHRITNDEKEEYVRYCITVATLLNLPLPMLEPVWRLIRYYDFQEVLNCHGDLTMENVLITEPPFNEVVFIDPGWPRGLPTRELDEAKILQSTLTLWDLMNGTSSFFEVEVPFPVTPIHIALLVTHWIRLANHPERHRPRQPDFDCNARDVIYQLVGKL